MIIFAANEERGKGNIAFGRKFLSIYKHGINTKMLTHNVTNKNFKLNV